MSGSLATAIGGELEEQDNAQLHSQTGGLPIKHCYQARALLAEGLEPSKNASLKQNHEIQLTLPTRQKQP